MSMPGILKKVFWNRRGELVACLLGLTLGWAISPAGAADADGNVIVEAALRPEPEEMLAYDSPEVQEEIFIHEMAAEFRLDQEIVRLVHGFSEEYVNPAAPEWRLLRSPEALAYLMLCVIHAESRGQPQAVGDQGRARGLTQIHTSTARLYGAVTPEALLDPRTNLKFSFRHFHTLLKRYQGNFALALYGWNRGPGTVDRLIRYGRTPANHYGKKVYRAVLDRRDEQRLMGN